MTTISIGKYRGLQQCSTENGAISVLALDHRQNLRAAMNPQDPNAVSGKQLSDFKIDVIDALAPAATAVLLDPHYGAAQVLAAGALPGEVGLLVAVEETGYTGEPTARRSQVLPGWSVAKVRRMGASAVKLLVYYHPDTPIAKEQEALVSQVAQNCSENDIPLFVEPLSYSPDPNVKKISPEERRRVVLETARRLTPLGVTILKAEFPVDITADTDEKSWGKACAELTQASAAPWVLLSASVDFDTYLRQVNLACQNGASGVAVGRAVWKEATNLTPGDRLNFLQQIALPRMARTTALCAALARPWTEVYSAPEVDESWYKGY